MNSFMEAMMKFSRKNGNAEENEGAVSYRVEKTREKSTLEDESQN